MEPASKIAAFLRHSGPVRPRRPILAVLLSFCPGLGQHYAGHIVRGIVVYVVLIAASWLAAIAFMFVESRVGVILLAVPFVGFLVVAYDAWRCASRQREDYRLKWFNRVWIYVGVTLALIVTVNPLMDMLVGRNIVRAYFVTSSSMAPSILNHDLLLVNKLAVPSRGDLVLLALSREASPAQLTRVIDDQLIRRVIAVEGDTVDMRGGVVYLNGERLTEAYVHRGVDTAIPLVASAGGDLAPIRVPDGHVFVLADNRRFGIDSRILGPLPAEKIAGKVTKIFWSWNFEDGGIKWSRTALSI